MFTIFRNDKVVLIKEFDKMSTVGQEYEVANITDTAVVLRDTTTKIAVGAICIDDFDKYFAKSLKAKKWTAWTKLIVNDNSVVFYRTNGVKVQVKSVSNIIGTACCNSGDIFNLYVGIRIAYLRMQNKILNTAINKIDMVNNFDDWKKLKELKDIIHNNNNTINKIIRDYTKE